MRTRERPYEWGAFLGALLLAGCAEQDIRGQHFAACEAYADRLARASVWEDLDAFSTVQLMVLDQVKRTATPVCLGKPSADGTTLVLRQTGRIEDDLLRAIILQDH